MRPAVSVVLCTFNRAATLSRAIRSALAQTHTDFELVIVDDGSTDDTAARVGAFVDPRIRYVRQANHGPSHARNTGIARARGRWIAFLDSDDEYRPRHLERRLRYVAAHRGVRVLHGGVELIGPLENHFALDVARTGRRIHLARCRLAGPLFVERRCLLAVGGFRELACSEDYEAARSPLPDETRAGRHLRLPRRRRRSRERVLRAERRGGRPGVPSAWHRKEGAGPATAAAFRPVLVERCVPLEKCGL